MGSLPRATGTTHARRGTTHARRGSAHAYRIRLRRQRLTQRAGRTAILQVAADVCGLHAQVMSSAELTLWARMDGLGPEDVEHQLWDVRSLVKTWAMRGTLHLIPAPDVPLWQAALSSFRHYLSPGWLKNFGVSAVELQWLADWRPADPDEAWREVGRRYLGGFGPAPAEDFARWWGGVSSARATRLFQSLGAEAAHVEVDGVRMWLLSLQLEQLDISLPQRCVRLLPAFDQYVIGAPRSGDHVLAPLVWTG